MEAVAEPQLRLQWLKQLEAEASSLYALLEHEQAALRERRLEAVMDLSAQKNLAAARLDHLLAQLPEGTSILAFLAEVGLDRHAEAQAAWTRVCHLAAQCRQLNEANGATIAVLQEHNRQLLAMLLGQNLQRFSYSADGQLQTEMQGRLLGAS